jgi:hypothetical protein
MDLDQGSQTRGPRAACGPPDAFVWPSRISKAEKIVNFLLNIALFESFLSYLWPAEAFFH